MNELVRTQQVQQQAVGQLNEKEGRLRADITKLDDRLWSLQTTHAARSPESQLSFGQSQAGTQLVSGVSPRVEREVNDLDNISKEKVIYDRT